MKITIEKDLFTAEIVSYKTYFQFNLYFDRSHVLGTHFSKKTPLQEILDYFNTQIKQPKK